MVKSHYGNKLYINLLKPKEWDRFYRNPELLEEVVKGRSADIQYVIIDEIQKIPKLLDVVHELIEDDVHCHFILTGSSSRKLKAGGANLLAGRLFVYHLFPITDIENSKLQIDEVLQWGINELG